MPLVDDLVANNRRYADGFDLAGLAARTRLDLVIVTCMDTRLDPLAMFGLRPGDAQVLRNAGGIVTDDVIRSLAVSQAALGTRAIVLVHHTDCGLRLSEDDIGDRIVAAGGERPTFEIGSFGTDIEGSVRRSMRALLESPYLTSRDQIFGFVYQTDKGALTPVG